MLRELLVGSRRFNELRRGVPLMSPALLSQRLKQLEEAGLVERRKSDAGGHKYHPTGAAEELGPVIEQLGVWGQRWVRSRFGPGDLDPGLLMWDLRRNIDPARFPPGRTLVEFELTDAAKGKRHWWLLSEGDEADLCLDNPGHEVDLYVIVDLRTMTRIWMGDLALERAVAEGKMRLVGPARLRRKLRAWLRLNHFAGVKPAGGAAARA